MTPSAAREVYAPAEVAAAAGVSLETVEALIRNGRVCVIRSSGPRVLIGGVEALRVTRALLQGRPIAPDGGPALLVDPLRARRASPLFAASSGLHVVVVVLLMLGASGAGPVAQAEPPTSTDSRLIYLTLAGPGGGGGGGGTKAPLPARQAAREGRARTNSPVPVRSVPPVAATPPVPAPRETPVEAPVVERPADEETAIGVLEAPPELVAEGAGPGENAGSGAGVGAGMGDGDGPGIGEGNGGGTGGGPYRPGSGVEPPTLIREVKPEYTEAARANGIQGDVLIEVIVRRDGSVGEARILRGLGHGLDERALLAVRQWRFNPARRGGVPVDVVVEVAMEFRLR
ncbi:MAG TPA: energy transducer TonB [Vicinamibacterales bacterium]|nr:energy transducer TonB [Vicinamibacterales bacterium]